MSISNKKLLELMMIRFKSMTEEEQQIIRTQIKGDSMGRQKKKEEVRTNAYFYQEEDFVLYFLTRPESEQESLLRNMLSDLRDMNKVIILYKNRLSGSEIPKLSVEF